MPGSYGRCSYHVINTESGILVISVLLFFDFSWRWTKGGRVAKMIGCPTRHQCISAPHFTRRRPLLGRAVLSGRPLSKRPPAGRRDNGQMNVGVQARIGFDMSQFEGQVDPEVGFFWTSVVLGLSLASFLATFAIFPQLAEFKEPEAWKDIYPKLIECNTESVEPPMAAECMKKGGTLLDVSMELTDTTIEGSIRVPLYQPIEGWSLPKVVRRLGFAFFGVEGTERSPGWLEEVERMLPKDQQVLIIDEAGGSLESKKGLELGTQSRSLKAVHFLQNAGYTNVKHVKGGVRQWKRDKLPVQMNE